jgi:Arc/MetJ-type ribon-helix-helix transcriptional regulator
MTVELKPETERLVQEEIKSGHFHTVDELIVQGVHAWREKHQGGVGGPKAEKEFRPVSPRLSAAWIRVEAGAAKRLSAPH